MRPPLLVAAVASAGLLAAACQTAPAPAPPPPPAQPAAAPAPPPRPPSPTFEPGPSIVCDRRTQVCRYGETASPALTRLYFGEGAAQRLTAPPAVDPATGVAPPAPELLDPIFKPSPWQSCDTLVATCYDANGANVELTRLRFGQKAASELKARQDRPVEGRRVVRFGETVTCDQLSQVCYDRLGAGYGATRLYLGEAPADTLLPRLQASPQS
jgi:hypothetical protein